MKVRRVHFEHVINHALNNNVQNVYSVLNTFKMLQAKMERKTL